MRTELWDWLVAGELCSVIIRDLGLDIAEVIVLASRWLFKAVEADSEIVSAAFLATVDRWPEAPTSETLWNIMATLVTALIAAGAAIFAAWWAASFTMENARALQNRERRLEEKSVAALLSADLHRKLVMLVHLLPQPQPVGVNQLVAIGTNTKVLEAALPKLGALGQQGTANLLTAFDGLELLASDARGRGWEWHELIMRMRHVALHIGRVVNTLCELYELDRPEPLEKAQIDLESIGLKKLKDLGL